MPVVHLVCGVPGSGKSTLASKLVTEFDAVRLCPDDWMVCSNIDLHDSVVRDLLETTQKKVGLMLLANGRDVVVEWGTWAAQERVEWVDATNEAGFGVVAYFLNLPIDVVWLRIQRRNLEQKPADRMTYEEVVEAFNIFQSPKVEELTKYVSVVTITA